MNFKDWIREVITTRGAQLISRYLQAGLVSLGTYLGVKYNSDALASFVAFVVPMIIAGLLHLLDLWQNTQAKLDVAARAFDKGADALASVSIEKEKVATGIPSTPKTIRTGVMIDALTSVKSDTQIIAKMPDKETPRPTL